MNWQQLLTNSDKQTRLISPCLLVKTETNQQKHTKKPPTVKILVKILVIAKCAASFSKSSLKFQR